MTKQLTALAEKVEGAEGASAELDTLIYAAINGWPVEWRGDALVRLTDFYPIGTLDPSMGSRWFSGHIGAPPYTRSLDAALTLIPDGWFFSIGEKRGLPRHIRFLAWLNDHNTPDGIAVRHVEGSAATPALALTAACLRAKAALSSNKSEK